MKLSDYFSESSKKKFKDVKSGFRNLDDEKIGRIDEAYFINLVTKSGITNEQEAKLLFLTQDKEKKGYLKFDQFLELLDTDRLRKRFSQNRESIVEYSPRTLKLRKRGDVIKNKLFEKIREKTHSRGDYREVKQ